MPGPVSWLVAPLRWPRRRGTRAAGSLARVRLTAFWERMHAQFGEAYAASVAQDYVIAVLGDRTVNQALADGVAVVTVWRGVCEAFELPERVR
jgi:Protein of unknown function (DUF3046)